MMDSSLKTKFHCLWCRLHVFTPLMDATMRWSNSRYVEPLIAECESKSHATLGCPTSCVRPCSRRSKGNSGQRRRLHHYIDPFIH